MVCLFVVPDRRFLVEETILYLNPEQSGLNLTPKDFNGLSITLCAEWQFRACAPDNLQA
jgi:hypothetical protein